MPLYQLPNGDHITLEDVRGIHLGKSFELGDRRFGPHVVIEMARYTVPAIYFSTPHAAKEFMEQLATAVNDCRKKANP